MGSSEQSLAGKKALVTGGASGIGLACAKAFTAAGATVTICDFNEEAATSAAQELGAETWIADLSKTEELEDLQLDYDILVNNAGIQKVSPIHEFEPDTWRFMHRLMVEAPFLLTRAVLPGMYERGFGRVIHISSVHGLRASAYKSAYVAAKHAIEGFSKVTALEGAEHGVTSNCINPAYVRTALVEKQIADQASTHGITEDEVVEKIMLKNSAIKRLVEADEVASLATWLASDTAGMVTGTSYTIDGGWTAK
ncbi:MAG TPA: 3-hydroxybutyrate dehydrogenase [Candidatus Corynebacterium gallistercoris]|uniref:3-oxoacyl-[acyl-carrier-protein] reductase MabA n=1 Tax=Candidatus Corynebacterium gallistercoris TaxID=2838530 RepID=A0A9D1RWC6_9CORY|nr:3-hydroxybutyrate dehydrogenase [Candidatus Corynebacterium gallistercoris]